MKRKLCALLCAVTLMGCAAPAFASETPMPTAPTESEEPAVTPPMTPPKKVLYPAEVRAGIENGISRIEKVYYLTSLDNPDDIPVADFEREGYTYTLLDLLENDQTETNIKEHVEVLTLNSQTKDMKEILQMLEPTIEVKTEDGYSGVLALDHTSIKVEAAGYQSSSRTVSASRTYPNLSDPDVALIPKSVEEGGRTLTLADVSWQEASTEHVDGYDLAVRYTAVASYTGTATSRYATGYVVTADYKGDVVKTSCDTVVYTAIFSAVDSALTEAQAEDVQHGLPAYLILLLVLLGAGGLGAAGYFGRKAYQHYQNKKRGYE